MADDHNIPRLLLKAFSRQQEKPFLTNVVYAAGKIEQAKDIRKIAASANYYSKALDAKITRYEQWVTRRVDAMRSVSSGTLLHPKSTAEVFSHLCVRCDNLRRTLIECSQQAALALTREIRSEEFLLDLFGLNEGAPNKVLIAMARVALARRFGNAMSGPDIAEYLTNTFFPLVRPLSAHIVTTLLPTLNKYDMIGELDVASIIAETHNEFLETNISPEERTAAAAQFDWRAIDCNSPLLLSDCVGVALIGSDHYAQPWSSTSLSSDIRFLLFPVSSSRLVIGSKAGEAPSVPDVCLSLASCSVDFFVTNYLTDHSPYARHIGTFLRSELAKIPTTLRWSPERAQDLIAQRLLSRAGLS